MPNDFESFDTVQAAVEDQGVSHNTDDSNQVPETDLDTFDNIVPAVAQKAEEKPAPKAEEVDKDSNVAMLEDEEAKKDDKAEDKPKEEEKKAEAPKEEPKAEEKPQIPKGKVLKAKKGDQIVDLDGDVEIPVKVDGEVKYYKLSEARNKLSGVIKVEKELANANQIKTQVLKEKQDFQVAQQNLNNILSQVTEKLDKEDGDPFDALYFLLDLTGRNVVQYKERVVQNNAQLFEKLMDMSETERKLYWKEQEADFFKRQTESRAKAAQEHSAMVEWKAKVDKLRETRGVSEDQYAESYQELSSKGWEDNLLTPEVIVDYASLKPHLQKAADLVNPYAELMDDKQAQGLLTDIAQSFREGKISESEVKQMLEDTFAASSTVKTLNELAPEPPKAPPAKVGNHSGDHVESFDDFEYMS